MPKMYRIVEGGSYTWEYVDAVREDGKPDPGDKVLARSTETWQDEDDAEDAAYWMQQAPLKRRYDSPRRPRPKRP